MKKILLTAAAALAAVFSAAGVSVTAKDLRTATPFAPIVRLGEDGGWVSVGSTELAGWKQDLAHLDEDGRLVLIDDGGFQFHAVWAASRPVRTSDNWEMRFTYAVDLAYKSPTTGNGMWDAGGWGFVMQSSGPNAYGSRPAGGGDNTGSGLLGAPYKSYGILFHRYFYGVRWVSNSRDAQEDSDEWMHFLGSRNRTPEQTFTEGLDIDINSPIDVSVGCTGCVWTVTFRQEGREPVVLEKNFAPELELNDDEFYIGFTGGSTDWGSSQAVGAYQTISDVVGKVEDVSLFEPDEYRLGADRWSLAGKAEFVDGKGLLIEKNITGSGNGIHAAVGRSPLYRDEPFSLDFSFSCENYKAGAQGVSFSLLPQNTPLTGSSQSHPADFFYPNMDGSCGFYLRPYNPNADGFGWHVEGHRLNRLKYIPLKGGESVDCHVEYDGKGVLTAVLTNRTQHVGGRFSTNLWSVLHEKFYPAFNGATPSFGDTDMTVYVDGYRMEVAENSAPEFGDMTVSGQKEFLLSTRNAVASDPSAYISRLTLAEGASVVVSPESAARGGSLAAGETVVSADASVSSVRPCAFLPGRLLFTGAARLTLSGDVAVPSGKLQIALSRGVLNLGRDVKLLDISDAAGLDGVEFELVDDRGGALDPAIGQLRLASGALWFMPRTGIVIKVK
jgi:hypothetical protein